MFLGWDGAVRGLLVVADNIKPTSARAITGMKPLGLRPVLLTGDNERAARAIAAEVGTDEVIAEVLPADKVHAVRGLQADGRVVAMVGDGVNDAAALAQADLGLAMGTGTDAAIEASDLTQVRGDLRAAVDAIRLARRILATVKGQPVLGLRLQRRRPPRRRRRAPQPDTRRRRYGLLQRLRRSQQPPAPPLPLGRQRHRTIMSTHPEHSAKSDRLDRIRAIIELVGVATLTLTHLVSAATALTTATRRRARCR